MRHLRSTALPFPALIVLVILASAGLAACGGGDDSKSTSAREGFDSSYCETARNWAAHEVSNRNGDVQYQRGGPAALRRYWKDYVAYTETSLEQAPPIIHEAAAIKARGIRRVTPLLEKYGFDPKRAQAEASASEQARFQPTPQEQKAQDATHAYDDRVCLYGGNPPAAKVKFEPNPAARPYCEAVVARQEAFETKVASKPFDPDAFRAHVQSDVLKALDKQDATAPSEIAADVKAENEWIRTRSVKVLEDFDYDLRRLLREGDQDELAVFTEWDPEIREHTSRVTAYEEQVCRIES
jgi:hypothetical protein